MGCSPVAATHGEFVNTTFWWSIAGTLVAGSLMSKRATAAPITGVGSQQQQPKPPSAGGKSGGGGMSMGGGGGAGGSGLGGAIASLFDGIFHSAGDSTDALQQMDSLNAMDPTGGVDPFQLSNDIQDTNTFSDPSVLDAIFGTMPDAPTFTGDTTDTTDSSSFADTSSSDFSDFNDFSGDGGFLDGGDF